MLRYDTHRFFPLLALLLALLLGGCGGGGEEETSLPADYTVGTQTLPSITQAAGLTDATCVAREEGESRTYTYGGVAEPGQMVSDYAGVLGADLGFSVIDEEGTVQAAPDYTAAQGTVRLGREAESGAGCIVLELDWQEGGIIVTACQDASLEITQPAPSAQGANAITMEQAVTLVEGMDPAQLGLSSSGGYEYFAQEGLVDVDGQLCIEVTVYTADTHQIAGTFMVRGDGGAVYHLDPGTRQVTQVA